MLQNIIRFVVVFAAIALGIKFAMDGIWLGVLAAILALAFYFWRTVKENRVFLAWMHVGRQNFDKAEAVLSKVPDPDALKGSQKSYYFMTKGVLFLSKQKLDPAEKAFKKALSNGLKDNDKSMVYMQLTGIEMGRGNKKKATELLAKAKKLKHHKNLDPEIAKLESMMKQVGKQQRQQHMGGRRGRPF